MDVLWRNFIIIINTYFVFAIIFVRRRWRNLRLMNSITSINAWEYADMIIAFVILLRSRIFSVPADFKIWNDIWVLLWNKDSGDGVCWIIFEENNCSRKDYFICGKAENLLKRRWKVVAKKYTWWSIIAKFISERFGHVIKTSTSKNIEMSIIYFRFK